MKIYDFTVFFKKHPDGRYIATVPILNDLTTEGDTLDEAKVMVREAIEGYLECLEEDHLPVPVEQAEKVSVSRQ